MSESTASVVTLQLVLVRSLLQRADAARREGNDVGLMTALLLADVAVETAVKQVLFDKNQEFGRQDKLSALLDLLVKAIPQLAGRPELSAARRLREARNPVQHAGQVPSAASVSVHMRDAELFLFVLVKEAFGLDFASVSAASLVRADDLRAALAASIDALEAGKIENANLYLAAAFRSVDVSVRHWSRRVRGVDTRMEMFAGVWLDEIVISVFGPEHPAATMTRLEDQPDDHQALLTVGFPLMDVSRLHRLGERALAYVRSRREKDPEPLQGEPPSSDEVGTAIEILARQITHLEATQPDLFAPRPSLLAPGPKT